MKTFLSKNILWIILIAVVLIGTNALTWTHYTALSRKERKENKRKLDSLNLRNSQIEILHAQEITKRKKLSLEDSALLVQYKVQMNKDSVLIKKQKGLISKFKTYNVPQTLSKLDSAYEAENH